MTAINKNNKLVTLINIFTVEPAKQQQLVDLLIHATETSMRHLPGFISANILAASTAPRWQTMRSGEASKTFKRCRRIPPPSHTWSRQPLLPSSSRVCMKLSILSLRRQTSN